MHSSGSGPPGRRPLRQSARLHGVRRSGEAAPSSSVSVGVSRCLGPSGRFMGVVTYPPFFCASVFWMSFSVVVSSSAAWLAAG